jgi:hypothetical protein
VKRRMASEGATTATAKSEDDLMYTLPGDGVKPPKKLRERMLSADPGSLESSGAERVRTADPRVAEAPLRMTAGHPERDFLPYILCSGIAAQATGLPPSP